MIGISFTLVPNSIDRSLLLARVPVVVYVVVVVVVALFSVSCTGRSDAAVATKDCSSAEHVLQV